METTVGNSPSIEQIKAGMRATWMAGDFGVIAKTIGDGGEEFIQRLAIPSGSRVLDVATGTGNLALPLALSGCLVTGVDIATNLLEQARARATEADLDIRFDEGDAEELPYPDASFDAVVTMFGAMFAPQPERVASEFARVLRPGGLLAMANWNPESFSGAMFRIGAKHAPPPPGLPAPVLWGNPAVATERLGEGFQYIETKLIPIDFEMAMPPNDVVELFRTYFGPTKMAFLRLDPSGQVALEADLRQLWSAANKAANPATDTLVCNEYLQVTATRR